MSTYNIENREKLKKCFSESLIHTDQVDNKFIIETMNECYTKLDFVFTPCVEQCVQKYLAKNFNPEPNILSFVVNEINIGACYYDCETY